MYIKVRQMKRGQGSIEYVMLIAGVIVFVTLITYVVKSTVLIS